MTFDWICNKYKGKFPDLFNKITQGPPENKIEIFDECAATEINQHIHESNAVFENTKDSDHTSIPIKYRQNEDLACDYYSLASALHHVQDK